MAEGRVPKSARADEDVIERESKPREFLFGDEMILNGLMDETLDWTWQQTG